MVTTNMRAGYLRKNGVPYSADATVTEYFDVVAVAGRSTAGRHDRRRRSAVSSAAVHRQLAFQEGSGRFQMGSHAMFGQMVTFRPCRRSPLSCCLVRAPSAFAQFELVGSWAARNTEDISRDSYPVDYVGLPLNDEGRTRALTYNESQLAMIERQCEGWPQFYFVQGPFGLRIWSDTEPIKGTRSPTRSAPGRIARR